MCNRLPFFPVVLFLLLLSGHNELPAAQGCDRLNDRRNPALSDDASRDACMVRNRCCLAPVKRVANGDSPSEAYRLYRERQYLDAAQMFARLAETGKQAPSAYYMAWRCYAREGKHPALARKYYRAFIESTNHAAGTDIFGRTLQMCHVEYEMTPRQKEEYRARLDAIERKLTPGQQRNPAVHLKLALAYDQAGAYSKVVQHSQMAVKLDPGYKTRLYPLVKELKISAQIEDLIQEIMSKRDALSDEQLEYYAAKLGSMLGR